MDTLAFLIILTLAVVFFGGSKAQKELKDDCNTDFDKYK